MASAQTDSAVDFGVLLAPLIRARILILAMAGIGVLLGVAHYLFATPQYEAKVVILPDLNAGSSLLGGASDLAMVAGIRLGAESEPTLYFRDILLSDLVLDRVLTSAAADAQTVQAMLGFGAELAERERAVRHLRRLVSVTRNNRTGIVKVGVRTDDKALSRTIANHLVATLDEFLKQSQTRSATGQFEFLSREIERADESLDGAEKDLAAFRVRNRLIEQSPELQREASRLQREVVIRESVLIELRKQAEILKISANEEMPKVQVIEPARVYQEPIYPILYQSLLVGVLLLVFLTMAIIYVRAYLLPTITRQLADG